MVELKNEVLKWYQKLDTTKIEYFGRLFGIGFTIDKISESPNGVWCEYTLQNMDKYKECSSPIDFTHAEDFFYVEIEDAAREWGLIE